MSKRLPGDARVADLAHAKLIKDQRNKGMVGPSIRTLSPDELQARVSRSVNIANPADNTDSLSQEMEGLIQLRISDVDPYDKNPRQHENERYDDIKESIRVSNVLSPLVVTRRPGAPRFMVGAGGNTRLKAQQELWAETGEARFEYLLGIYRPWASEVTTLVSHLAENELRGGLTFWDRANGVWALKREIEAELGRHLSLRQLRDEMLARGLRVAIGVLSFYGFAVEQLAELGPATARLTHPSIRDLQPSTTHLQRYCMLNGLSDADWATLRAEALKPLANILTQDVYEDDETEGTKRIRPLDPARIITALERAVAAHLNQSLADVQALRHLAETYPKASLDELRLRNRNKTLGAVPPSIVRPAPSPRTEGAAPPARTGQGSGAVESSPVRSVVTLQAQPSPRIDVSDDGTAGADPADDDPDLDTDANPHGSATDAIVAFTRACGVADLLRLCEALPSGYYMEIPAAGAFLDGDEAQPYRYAGWWIAAMHSGQIDGEHSDHMPEDSLWRQVQRMEAGHDETALQWHIETTLGNPPGLVELGQWFLHCPDHILASHESLLRRLRSLAGARQGEQR
ncbi:MAG: hypothetical protein JNK52_14950 [Zoogloeaceae bacterium]|nr:hypothetical protein [Zoogloeaceae bacterium]